MGRCRLLRFIEKGRHDCFYSKTRIVFKLHLDIVWGQPMHDFPCVIDNVSLTSSLGGQQSQPFSFTTKVSDPNSERRPMCTYYLTSIVSAMSHKCLLDCKMLKLMCVVNCTLRNQMIFKLTLTATEIQSPLTILHAKFEILMQLRFAMRHNCNTDISSINTRTETHDEFKQLRVPPYQLFEEYPSVLALAEVCVI